MTRFSISILTILFTCATSFSSEREIFTSEISIVESSPSQLWITIKGDAAQKIIKNIVAEGATQTTREGERWHVIEYNLSGYSCVKLTGKGASEKFALFTNPSDRYKCTIVAIPKN